jgi:hypothetical protein
VKLNKKYFIFAITILAIILVFFVIPVSTGLSGSTIFESLLKKLNLSPQCIQEWYCIDADTKAFRKQTIKRDGSLTCGPTQITNCPDICSNGECVESPDIRVFVSTTKDTFFVDEPIALTETLSQGASSSIGSAVSEEYTETAILYNSEEQDIINQITSSGTQTTISGEITRSISENLDPTNFFYEETYWLADNNGNEFQIFPDNIPSTGEADVSGLIFNGNLVPQNIDYTTTQAAAITGELTMAVFLVNSHLNPVEQITQQQAYNKIFDENNANSISNYIKTVSYDKVSVTGQVFGYLTLPITQIEMCDAEKLRDATFEVAEQQGLDRSAFGKKMIVHTSSGCNFQGRGIISIGASVLGTGTDLHEFGHSLGLNHANDWECGVGKTVGEKNSDCSSIEYADDFDIMGGYGHFNAIAKERLGWFDSSNILTTNNPGVYFIEPLEISGNGIKLLKVPKFSGTTSSVPPSIYSVEYRRPLNYDSSHPQALLDGAMVHFLDSGSARTNLLDFSPSSLDTQPTSVDSKEAILKVGEAFTDVKRGLHFNVRDATDDYLEFHIGREVSQIENNGNSAVTGVLKMKIQRRVNIEPQITAQAIGNPTQIGEWSDFENVLSNQQTIPAQSSLALTPIWDSVGWSTNLVGDYRLKVEFTSLGKTFEAFYEFFVVPFVCGDGICSPNENCAEDVSGCVDNACFAVSCTNGCVETLDESEISECPNNICYIPICTIEGCDQIPVAAGGTDEESFGCNGEFSCDGNGSCLYHGEPCSDSDGGINEFVKGTVFGFPWGNQTDYCSGGYVNEWYCATNGTTASTTLACPGSCQNGACVNPNLTCTDTDGGINEFVKGTVFGFPWGNQTDYCSGGYVNEWYCATNGTTASALIGCGDFSCNDGICTSNQTGGNSSF